jgi:hypothetical protein
MADTNPSLLTPQCGLPLARRKHHLPRGAELCPQTARSELTRLYLEHVRHKCIAAVPFLLRDELAVRRCGAQFQKIVFLFLSLTSKSGSTFCRHRTHELLFASRIDEMRTNTNVIIVVT